MTSRLRYAAIFALIATAVAGDCEAQAVRFNGTFTNVFGGSISLVETNDSFKGLTFQFPLTWTIDVTTDGQSITFNDLSAVFSGLLHLGGSPDSLVSIDLDFVASLQGVTFDTNPIRFGQWDIHPYQMDATVAGTYHSIGYSSTFDTSLQPASTSEIFETRLGFADWPNSLEWQQPESTLQRSIRLTPASTVLVEPFLELLSVTFPHAGDVILSAVDSVDCPCCGCGDFNGDDVTDGADFFAWQRGFGKTSNVTLADGDGNGDGAVSADDLALWQSHYGDPPSTTHAVPEPSTVALLALGLVSIPAIQARRSWDNRS